MVVKISLARRVEEWIWLWCLRLTRKIRCLTLVSKICKISLAKSTILNKLQVRASRISGKSQAPHSSILRSSLIFKSIFQVSLIYLGRLHVYQSVRLCLYSAFCKLRHTILSMRLNQDSLILSSYLAKVVSYSKRKEMTKRQLEIMSCKSVDHWKFSTSSLMLSEES